MGTIFISYSHDSNEHSERVLLLANRLRKNGLDCVLDQYETSPPEGWPKWMDRHLAEAEKVIIICTQTYWNRVMDEEKPGKGKGVKWESTLAYQYIYDDDSKNTRFIPVVFDTKNCQYIPTILKGATFYCLDTDDGYDDLYRRLTKQPRVEKPAIGTIKERPPVTPETPETPVSRDTVDISLYRLPVTGDRLFGRERELAFLDDAWTDNHTHIATLTAWGGVGKTALVNEWLNGMETHNYGGAQKVYGWSFYSQGAEEGKQASADDFFQETLQWFGDAHPEAGSLVDKGRRLARLAREQKALMVLDGLEPLQYPPGEVQGLDGKLKDQGMAAFLKELAGGNPRHPGLCVITTRVTVTDLTHRKGYAVKENRLEHLSESAGVELLKYLGVTTGREKDFKAAVTEYGGHALALTLLGLYIKRVHEGDIRRRDEILKLTKGKIAAGHHAQKVMEAYESWLGDSPERDILYLLGLFDRPVEKGAVEALKKDPAIPGLTDRLQGIAGEDWLWALSHLREARLLAEEMPRKPGTVGSLDCHPLVREHFGEKLRVENPAGWQAAHERLYGYFKDLPEKEEPDTLQEMEPLFAAVAHGCKAGLHGEALDEVYSPRIQRGGETNYCCNKLGAFGADLAAVSHFFDVPWRIPAAGLSERHKALILSWAAFRLRAVGRLREAIQPMKAVLEMLVNQKEWKGAALNASNLSELLLSLGDVPGAVDVSRRSVTHADRSGDAFEREVDRTTLADALHQSGAVTEAEQWFREAEAMQKKSQPQHPYLYSQNGYQFCDLLLSQGKTKEVIERAEKALEISERNGWLLAIALDKLTLGRAGMMQALEKTQSQTHPKSDRLSPALTLLEQAVEGLREAGIQYYLPSGLLARAELYRHLKAFKKAWDDLNEAHDIAETGDMKLHLCDYHLEAARLCRAGKNEKDAKEHDQTAAELIKETGYGRRKRLINNG